MNVLFSMSFRVLCFYYGSAITFFYKSFSKTQLPMSDTRLPIGVNRPRSSRDFLPPTSLRQRSFVNVSLSDFRTVDK